MNALNHGPNATPNGIGSRPDAPEPVVQTEVAGLDLDENGPALQVNEVLRTNGTSLWSQRGPADVRITSLDIVYWGGDEDSDYAELGVFFDPATWDTSQDGLIYTDEGFADALEALLIRKGMPPALARTANYSEQGMQSPDYVSLDTSRRFGRVLRALAVAQPGLPA
jgi:hypothetical protein